MKTILALYLCIFSLQVYAQTGQAFIQKALGGSGTDIGQTFMHTSDGGFIAAGVTNSKDGDVSGNKGGVDLWIVKLHSDLSIDWKLCVGTRKNEEGSIIRETVEGDFLVLGNTIVKTDLRDILLAKIHGTGPMKGTLAWQKTFGGTGDDQAGTLEVVPTGEILIAGESNSNNGDIQGNHGSYDVWVAMLSATGNINWQRSVGGLKEEYLRSAEYTNDGGVIISAVSYSTDLVGFNGISDALIAKLHPQVTNEWQKLLGSTQDDSYMALKEQIDGKYIFTVKTGANDGNFVSATNNNVWAMQISSDGATINWKNNYGSGRGIVHDLVITNTNSIVITTLNSNIEILHINNDGSLDWSTSLVGGQMVEPGITRQTNDNGFLVFGQSNSADVFSNHPDIGFFNIYVAKLDVNGQKEWDQSFGGSGNDNLYGMGGSLQVSIARGPTDMRLMGSYLPVNLLSDNEGNYYFMANTNSADGDVTGIHRPRRGGIQPDIWFVKILAGTPVTRQKEKPLKEVETIAFTHRIYPNPNRGEARLSFTAAASVPTQVDLYTLGGQKLKTVFNQSTVSGMTYTIPINEQQLKPGTYFYVITSGKQRSSGKFIKY